MARDGKHGGFFGEILSAGREIYAGWSIAMRYAVAYLVLGMVWIHVEHHIIPGDNYVLKDSLFILTTALAFYLIVGKGVGKLHRSEEALRESEERLARILETNASGIIVLDLKGTVTFVNRAAEALLGFPQDRIIGRRYNALELEVENGEGVPHPLDLHPFAQVISTGRPVHDVELLLRRPGGTRSVLSVNAALLRDVSGAATGIVASITDITERKKAQIESLRESEERFRQMFEQNEEPIILFRAGTAEIRDANPAALALHGYSLEELVAGGPSLFVPPGESGEFAAMIAGIDEGSGVSVERATQRRKDGRTIIVSVRGKSIRLREGKVSYCSFRDITERITMEEEARSQQAQLIHTNRIASLGTLVSGVAHQINNPNNLVMFNASILGAAVKDIVASLDLRGAASEDFLVGGLPYSEMREGMPRLLEGISESSRRIKDIVDNLKEFAAQDRSALDCLVDVNAVTRAAVSILDHEIVHRTQRFVTRYAESLPMVRGYPQQLEQVVLNLVVNALQAVPDPSRGVKVETEMNSETGCVEIRVSDEGVGVPDDAIRRLGEPFYTTKADRGGLGLGLSICSSIVKTHKGAMTFRSEVGKGTTACVAIPAAKCFREGGTPPTVSA